MAIENDVYMTYDLTKHTYTFTNRLIEEKLNVKLDVRLGGSTEADLFREDTMYFIQDYLIDYTVSYALEETKQQLAYLIYANDFGEREALQRAYVEFVRYALQDEGDLVGQQTGLNVIKGQIVDIEKLRGDVELSSRLYRVLKNTKLLFKGQRVWYVPDDVEYGVDF